MVVENFSHEVLSSLAVAVRRRKRSRFDFVRRVQVRVAKSAWLVPGKAPQLRKTPTLVIYLTDHQIEFTIQDGTLLVSRGREGNLIPFRSGNAVAVDLDDPNSTADIEELLRACGVLGVTL